MKKERVFLLTFIFISLFIAGVYAQSNTTLGDIDENAELQETEGITPEEPTSDVPSQEQ